MHLSPTYFIFLLKYNNLYNSISIEFMTIFKAKISKKLPEGHFLNNTIVIKPNIGDEIFQYHDHFMNI